LALLHLRELQPPPARARDEGARQRLQTLAYELTVAEARERERIANGLHDSLGQLLAIAQFRLGELAAALEPAAGAPQARLAHKANELMALLAQASGETRRATFDLHSPLLRQLGLRAAIEGLGERLQRQSQLVVQVDGELDETSLAEPVQAVLLRIVRELLLNAYKHARATQVQVHLGADETGRAQIRVCDDGCGFTRAPGGAGFSPEGGFGLASAEAQMQAIGGQLAVRSAPGQGAAVVLTLPRRRGNRAARTLQ
jgi:signal transduction histidine kinase